jgi:putative flippase GtrA
LLYPLVYGVQYLVSISLLAVLVDYFGMVYWLAPFVIIGLTVPLSYAMTRWILHRFAPPSPPISPATPGDSDEQTTYRNR